MSIVIEQGTNPYRDGVQGKANEPITVAALLDRAEKTLGLEPLGHTLGEIFDRLDANAPRIAVIGGSPDHPAHILDTDTVLRAAAGIWERGGVPFHFSIPVLCDGTAQSNIGMSYSLQSRNAAAAAVVNQMESHNYHGAFVISGCDKTPLGITCGLVHLDRVRQGRGDAPVFATFSPSHVLRGGVIPADVRVELEQIADRAEGEGFPEIALEIRDSSEQILQCISNSAFEGVFTRAAQRGLLTGKDMKKLQRLLAIHTCHSSGGICAFNGTGNSSRNVVSALGLTHPAVELLTEPAGAERIHEVLSSLFSYVNKLEFSVRSMVRQNFANAVRIHSATGGSTNLMMHLVAAMIYAGYNVDVEVIEQIRHHPLVPDIFDYNLSEGRDIYALAEQCSAGSIRGMETVFYELLKQGIPMDVEAPTVTGTTWSERLSDTANLAADGIQENPIILSFPRRSRSGVELLRGNFFDTAVLKISGMTDQHLDQVDDQLYLVLFYENEEEANNGLLDVGVLQKLCAHPSVTREKLLVLAAHNSSQSQQGSLESLDHGALWEKMVEAGILKIMIVISGQGPAAFGMPEMFTPMAHINANRSLHRISALISDGRYSGTTFGAAIGHVTPEAIQGGEIGLLKTGDLLRMRLSRSLLELVDPEAAVAGFIEPLKGDLRRMRRDLGEERRRRIRERRRQIAATNRLSDVTDASRGVVPSDVAEEATEVYSG